MAVQVLNVSTSGLGIKSNEPFKVNFPVLIECLNLLVVANVRHCVKLSDESYLLGLEVHRTVDVNGEEVRDGLRCLATFDRRVRTAG
jgi:hypothetical protein